MCTGPLYHGWICARYWSRNLSCRSVGLWMSVNWGLKSVNAPSRSYESRICPSVPAPAPMPMVGISSSREMTRAIFAGTASNSSMKQPASWIASGFLHEARGVRERTLDGVVALIRHASEHECIRRAATDCSRVQHHHVHGGG